MSTNTRSKHVSNLALTLSTLLSACAVLMVSAAVLRFSTYPAGTTIALPWSQPWISIATVIFIASCLSSTVGFAFSALAGACVLHLVSDPVEAVQIMMVASIAIQAYCVMGLLQTISWKACAPFLIGGIVMMPAGIYLLFEVHHHTYAVAMGSGLTVYGTYMLFGRPVSIRAGGAFANALAGALGGLTGPLAAFPGAFVTIWCGMRGWDKATQRSIYQPYILVMQIVTLMGLTCVGGRISFGTELLAYTVPAVAGAYLGLSVFQKLSDSQFQKLVSVALVVAGLALALKFSAPT